MDCYTCGISFKLFLMQQHETQLLAYPVIVHVGKGHVKALYQYQK